jgi:RND family efflux transporter MFP subunit
MEYATIRAPFDGVVSRRLVDRGAFVQSATASRTAPLFTVQRVDQFRIFIEVPETDVPHVRAGTIANVKPYGMPGLSFDGTVTRISSSLNPGTRTMRTEIDLSNKDGALMHGMYAQVVLELDRRENVLTVPATALLTEGNKTFVFTARDGRAARTAIQTGLDDGIQVEVREGLDDSALVILAGKGLMSEGSPIDPILKNRPPGI